MRQLLNDMCELRRDLISDGYDEALALLKDAVPDMVVHEYPTGSEVWDWTIPPKWECYGGCIARPDGTIIVSTDDHPLHVMSYSQCIDAEVTHDELMKHLYWRDDAPDGVPFEFSYYADKWGFCVEANRLHEFDCDTYHVVIDSLHSEGTLKVGEWHLPGTTNAEIVVTAHVCHPFQANDNASGCVALVELANRLRDTKRKYGIRLLWVPETIGTIAHLANHPHLIGHNPRTEIEGHVDLPRIQYGIALDMLGNDNRLVLQRSPFGAAVDTAAELAIRKAGGEVEDYRQVVGNDEKIYNAVGVDIPCVSVSRARCWGKGEIPYHGYHTSLDTPDRLHMGLIAEAVDVVCDALDILDTDWTPRARGRGPVCLSKHGLWVDWREDRQLNLKQAEVLDMLFGMLTVADIAATLELDYWQLLTWINRMKEQGVVDD